MKSLDTSCLNQPINLALFLNKIKITSNLKGIKNVNFTSIFNLFHSNWEGKGSILSNYVSIYPSMQGVESYGCSINANKDLPTELRGASAAVHNGNVYVCGTWSQDFES